jgi:GT2 family glycosyltransferase
MADFRRIHDGESIVVCGCGESLNELERPERFVTVGVNDVGRRFTPDYLIVINPRSQFAGDRFRYVENSRALYVFTQLNLGLLRANVVKFRLGSYGGTNLSADTDVLHYTQNSPYVAMCLAAHMGARRIGLIGVDFTDHHFFARTGTHALAAQLQTIDEQYRRLGEALRAGGVEVFNLSAASRLRAFPKMCVEEFAALPDERRAGARVIDEDADTTHATAHANNPARANDATHANNAAHDTAESPLKIVSYATTPVAGVPVILARAISARTPHAARCVWAQNGYSNGVTFDGDLEWSSRRAQAEEELHAADLVVVHNGKIEPHHRRLLAGKAVLTMAHNYMWNVEQGFVRRGFPGVVVGQYQAALTEFEGWRVVPNPVPLWEPAFRPGPKGETITICYTPSGRHEKYAEGHRLYWHSKGYETTMRVLERLSACFPLRLEVIREQQISHAESLRMKRDAHVVIDECVTGSYHRNSLEGLAAGCVVVNGLGLRPAVVDIFRRCAPASQSIPFVRAGLEDLEGVLTSLIERGAQRLAEEGASNRRWMEEHWDFAAQWEQFWSPAVARALEHAGRQWPRVRVAARYEPPPSSQTSASQPEHTPLRLVGRDAWAEGAASCGGVSIVIPHGGRERLPHLAQTLASLRRIREALEIIVVEMDASPHADEVARRLADGYVFIRNEGVFHKARAMNAGLPFAARGGVVLWLDNDLLLSQDFLAKALAEMHRRQLDCLVPWTSVRYLSREDTAAVFDGRRDGTGDCTHVNAYFTRQGACGGAVLVRREFLARYGGMCEEFRGWGGEDNAWFYKARVLGRAAVTELPDQHLFHLYHADSGGYDATNHLEKNPHYNENVALLQATRRLSTRDAMLRRFPPPTHYTCPWEKTRRLAFARPARGAAASAADEASETLHALYDIRVEHVVCGDGEEASGSDAAGAVGECDALFECDAVVVFGEVLARRLLSDERLKETWPKFLAAHVRGRAGVFADAERRLLQRAGGHFAFDAEAARLLEEAGLDGWRPLGGESLCADSSRAALVLAQPLSLVLAAATAQSGAGHGSIQAQAENTTTTMNYEIRGALPDMAVALDDDLKLTEYEAFNHGRDYPRMRRWELPFAFFKSRLSSTSTVLDCTINPVDFAARLHSLYPHALYRHWNPVQRGQFALPVGVPDEGFDRVVCVNTLEHLLRDQREALLAELARKLKPGGLLVVTCDYYFEDFWSRPELLRMGVVRADRQEVFNGFNRVAPDELSGLCARHGLRPLSGEAWAAPNAGEAGLYRNVEPHPHACIGGVFKKGEGTALLPAPKRVALALLTWNTRDISLESLGALVSEAAMLRRLGHEPFIVVCDNGSTDGLREALRDADERIEIEHEFILNAENRGSSVARNQIIDCALGARSADYLLFTDGDIEVIPFSSFAMLRHMENNGHRLGCVGAAMYGQSPARERTTPFLYSLAGLQVDEDNLLAWTQYGMFRREVFEAGVRFDESAPFDREGWGCEDNDLAFQMHVKGYLIRRFNGMTYLHRDINSSVRVLRALGVDPSANYEQRRRYVVQKWEGTPAIDGGPLKQLRNFRMRFSA